MTVHITGSLPALVDETLDALEGRLGVSLPSEYRQFLLHHNGGRPEPNLYETENGLGASVHAFLSVGDGGIDDLERTLSAPAHEGLFLPEMLPIARDPGGNLICLSLRKRDYGSVHFWNHEREANAFVKIARNFAEFIDGLHERDPFDDIIVDIIQTQDVIKLQQVIDAGWDVNSERYELIRVATINNLPALARTLLENGARLGPSREIVARAENLLDRDYSGIKALFGEYSDHD